MIAFVKTPSATKLLINQTISLFFDMPTNLNSKKRQNENYKRTHKKQIDTVFYSAAIALQLYRLKISFPDCFNFFPPYNFLESFNCL